MNYDEAVEYAKNRRTDDPAIYNKERLNENPVPALTAQNDDQSDASDQSGEGHSIQSINESEDEDLNAPVHSPIMVPVDPLESSAEFSTASLAASSTLEEEQNDAVSEDGIENDSNFQVSFDLTIHYPKNQVKWF